MHDPEGVVVSAECGTGIHQIGRAQLLQIPPQYGILYAEFWIQIHCTVLCGGIRKKKICNSSFFSFFLIKGKEYSSTNYR
jgi:hypothetical protein